MKSSKKRSIHNSSWKKIIVIVNKEIKIFELNNTGRLNRPFNREKSRNISKLFGKLISTSAIKEKKETNETIDINSEPNLESSSSYLFSQTNDFEDDDQVDALMIDLF